MLPVLAEKKLVFVLNTNSFGSFIKRSLVIKIFIQLKSFSVQKIEKNFKNFEKKISFYLALCILIINSIIPLIFLLLSVLKLAQEIKNRKLFKTEII